MYVVSLFFFTLIYTYVVHTTYAIECFCQVYSRGLTTPRRHISMDTFKFKLKHKHTFNMSSKRGRVRN